MVVRVVSDDENGRKWEIIKHEYDRYSVKYYEYYKMIGWRCLGTDRNISKDCIEFEFNTKVI